MPGTISDGPSVAMSFANNFWGLDNHDEGVERLISRMLHAKQTNDELKSFYNTRAAIEDEYARKLLSLSRKPLGSQEAGTLRASLDVMRGEVEATGKSHQQVAQQMKSELEEPLAAFAGGMKERRKIIQSGVEKLLKTKIQQTQHVNKTRDKYEQECLKIKGYLAQGHMVMGQEERKNKAKLEKTQINLATSNTDYENAVRILEETTGRWNRDWKAAADKFQDLEEERLDFTKSSLWTFANIASTVCVSDDGSCEKIRLSLENCEVEKDIITFIKEQGTGQEIPDPPKYINFCRGDVDDSASEVSEAESYSVAQFQRTINPAFRTSSPQPSTYESHHDPTSSLAKSMGHKEPEGRESREATITPQRPVADRPRPQQRTINPAFHTSSPQPSTYESHHDPTSSLAKSMGHKEPEGRESREATVTPQRPVADKPRPQQRTINPAFRTSSPQPSTYESHHDPTSSLAKSMGHKEPGGRESREATVTPQRPVADRPRPQQLQFQRTINPAFCTSSPQPSTYESHHDPTSSLAKSMGHKEPEGRESREATVTPQRPVADRPRPQQLQYDQSQHGPLASVPHDPYPMDGMTMLCRTAPPSDRSVQSPMRPSSRDSQSDCSNPTSFSSVDAPSGQQSPIKQPIPVAPAAEKTIQKKKSQGFFQSRSPFRRKSRSERENPLSPATRNTWAGRSGPGGSNSPSRPQIYQPDPQNSVERCNSEEPVDPRASFQLNVGNNVFDVATPGKLKNSPIKTEEDLDPIAQALAELKGVTKQSSVRVSADAHYGMATPAPGAAARSLANTALVAGMRGTPPPSYDQPPMQRLGAPQPAHTAKAMQQTRQRYVDQAQNVFGQGRPDSRGYNSPQSRPGTRGNDVPRAISPAPPRSVRENDVPRAISPAPPRSASPRPGVQPQNFNRSASPNLYGSTQGRTRAQSIAPTSRVSDSGSFRGGSGNDNRAVSPAPFREHDRLGSSQVSNGDMALQLSMSGGEYGSQRGRQTRQGSVAQHNGRSGSARPVSYYNGPPQNMVVGRQRSKSVADGRQFNRDGRPILHFARAMYMYQAAIPEELSFAKGDVLAVLRLQDDGWWEAEVAGQNGRPGLVPSNYLQNC